MRLETMNELLVDQLRDMYSAEMQITRALPKIIERVNASSLREALVSHLDETERQVERLGRAFELLGTTSRGPRCRGMEGLLEEAAETLAKTGDPHVIDAALIAQAQRVEHYEIAAYGCAVTYAKLLGYHDTASLLMQSLAEEARADETLSRIAEEEVNEQALMASMGRIEKNGK